MMYYILGFSAILVIEFIALVVWHTLPNEKSQRVENTKTTIKTIVCICILLQFIFPMMYYMRN